ncbi:MAG: copper amine oxidase N-terminal domain-containing protein [Clostridiales bacterium]|nr:copper amine oxidase N-terminal domain-containing protein [Clostridiales bacterium]
MKKIIVSIALICALLIPQVSVLAARTDCSVSLSGAYYKMSNGKTENEYPELILTTSGNSLSDMAFHLVLEGARWDYNKMSRIDSNISVTASGKSDIQLKFTKDFFKTQNEGSASTFSIPLYANSFEDGYIYLNVTDTPTYMSEASFLFACNTSGAFTAKYDEKADIYRSGVSTLSDITINDTANFAAVPGETTFNITLGTNAYSFETLPEVEGTGKYEGKVSVSRDSAASITVGITEETETGTGSVIIKGLQVTATSTKISSSPDITITSKRKLNVKTNEGGTVSRSVDAKTTFSSGNFIEAAAIANVTSSAASEDEEENTALDYGDSTVLTFTVGDDAYILNGERVEISSPCIISEGRTMLPVRALAEAISADSIYYDAETKTALIVKFDTNVSIEQNGDYMYVNGEQFEVSSPAINSNGSMYLPVRDICEAFGLDNISFDAETKTVTIVF